MKKSSDSDLSRILAWQGLTFPLPEDWSFAAFSGDWDSGYLRAEGPDDVALELKWKHDKASPSLKGVLKSFVKQLNKASGRKGPDVEVKEKPKALPSVPQGNGVSQTFSWKASVYGVGAVWHCLECRRIILVQVTSPQTAIADSLARSIIPKIQDHPEGDLCDWCLYEFAFSAPKEFKLEKQNLRSGHLSLEFRHKGRRLIVERYGPANVLLKRDTLAEWSTSVKPIYALLKPFQYKKELIEEGDHETVRLAGFRKSPLDRIRRAGSWIIRRPAPGSLSAKIWRCDASNRVYMTMVEASSAEAPKLTESVSASIRCHEESDGKSA